MERSLMPALRRTKTLPVIIMVVAAAAAAARALVVSHAAPPQPLGRPTGDDQAGARGRPAGSLDHDMTSEVITVYPNDFGRAEIKRPRSRVR